MSSRAYRPRYSEPGLTKGGGRRGWTRFALPTRPGESPGWAWLRPRPGPACGCSRPACPGDCASRADQAGVVFALISAVLYSFYLLGSARLVREIGPRPATAWGLSIGSLPMLAWFPPWTAHASGDPVAVAALIALVAVAATAAAFSLSQASLKRITPTEFAVTSTLEPALAAVAAAIFLGVTLRGPQYVGGALTILAVLLLAPALGLRGRGGQF